LLTLLGVTPKIEPLLFTAWLREFSRSILLGRFGDAVSDYWDLRPRVMESVLTERPDWCDDPKRPGEESCGSRLAEALEAALARLRRDYGPDMAQWKWGRAHVAVFANPVFSRIPVLRDWLEISADKMLTSARIAAATSSMESRLTMPSQ